MKTLMIAAMGSGEGKTVTCCALLAALKRQGVRAAAFKSGPDYIDPLFHRQVLEIPSRNLDIFLQGEEGIRRSLCRTDADFALIEGAMGYYDGRNNTTEASAYALARLTKTPVVLAVMPKGSGLTLAAQIRGMLCFRPDSMVKALILANCPVSRLGTLAPVLERETGLPVLGCLPPSAEACFESRHLGLQMPDEIRDIRKRLEKLGERAEACVDLERLKSLAGNIRTAPQTVSPDKTRCRIAVARDEAFCFLYEDSLDALREEGAELCFFSPLHGGRLPDAEGLYLPGGYPELYARELSENSAMRKSIAHALLRGQPALAECGGFLYLQDSLEDAEGKSFPMCGVFHGTGFRTDRLQRFGYVSLTAKTDSLLFRKGEEIPAHEFHYWDCTGNGTSLEAGKADGRHWECGFASANLYAGFPHLHLGGRLPLAERFVKGCEKWKQSRS